jgi:FlaG/FlaF family flagellin (archaellin)
MAVLTVLPKPGRHPFVERRQAVAVPFLQGVASKRMNAMTQDTAGTVMVQTASGVESIDVDNSDDLYHINVRAFAAAIRGEGRPTATGDEALSALMVALAR